MMQTVNQSPITTKLEVSSHTCDWGYKALLEKEGYSV